MGQQFFNNFMITAVNRTHHKNSGSNWKPACTLPLLPRCPTPQDGQPDPLGSKSRASNGSADSRGDSVRAATEPDWCGVATSSAYGFLTLRSECTGSGESARLISQQSWMPRVQTSKLPRSFYSAWIIFLFGPRKIKSHNTI